jgi:hypothetical protein
LLLMAIAFGCGLVAARFLWRPPIDWIVASLLLMACAAGLSRRRPTAAFFVALLSVAMTGALAHEFRPIHRVAFPSGITDGESVVVAHVIRDGVVQRGMFGGEQQSLDVEAESVRSTDGSEFTQRMGLRLSIYARKSDYEDDEQQAAGTLPIPVMRYGAAIAINCQTARAS